MGLGSFGNEKGPVLRKQRVTRREWGWFFSGHLLKLRKEEWSWDQRKVVEVDSRRSRCVKELTRQHAISGSCGIAVGDCTAQLVSIL